MDICWITYWGFVIVLFLLRKDIPKIRSKNWRKPINPIKRITAQQMKKQKIRRSLPLWMNRFPIWVCWGICRPTCRSHRLSILWKRIQRRDMHFRRYLARRLLIRSGNLCPEIPWHFFRWDPLFISSISVILRQRLCQIWKMTGIRALPCIHIMKPDGAGIWCIRISGLTKCTLLIILTRQRSYGNILPTRNCMIRLSSVMKTVKIMKNCSLWELPCRTTVVIRKPMTIFRRIIIKLDVLIRMPTSICPWYTRVMRQ